MRATGIIAEYNPFHNGHAYQIRKAKELSKSDYLIAAISGNFVQRGAPAMLDKYSRTAMALQNGADFVFELPTLWSVSSAEYFAAAGTALFHALGCVDTLCFGCETPDLPLMTEIAKILIKEPEEYKILLASYLKQGFPFPSAREKALTSYLSQQNNPDLCALLKAPNNILAIEYIKALLIQNSSIRPLPILRQGDGYHTADFHQEYCSATAVRNLLLHTSDKVRQADRSKTLFRYVPLQTAEKLLSSDTHFLTEQDFSQALYYKLLCEQETGFSDYADVSVELSNRMVNALPGFTDYHSFCKTLKSKEVTYTRISRNLFHILLNFRKEDYENGKKCGYIPYLRLLGFRKEASPFFSEIKKHTLLPLITKPSKYASYLTGSALSMFCQDVFASNLYYGTLAQKSKVLQKNEFQRSIVIL